MPVNRSRSRDAGVAAHAASAATEPGQALHGLGRPELAGALVPFARQGTVGNDALHLHALQLGGIVGGCQPQRRGRQAGFRRALEEISGGCNVAADEILLSAREQALGAGLLLRQERLRPPIRPAGGYRRGRRDEAQALLRWLHRRPWWRRRRRRCRLDDENG